MRINNFGKLFLSIMLLKFKNILLFLVALQMINIGLFAQDMPVLTLQYSNQINSLTEYLAEVTLRIKDAFPEHGHHNKKDKHSSNTSLHLKTFQFHLFKPKNSFICFEKSLDDITILHKCPLPIFYKDFVVEIIAPPPKV